MTITNAVICQGLMSMNRAHPNLMLNACCKIVVNICGWRCVKGGRAGRSVQTCYRASDSNLRLPSQRYNFPAPVTLGARDGAARVTVEVQLNESNVGYDMVSLSAGLVPAGGADDGEATHPERALSGLG
jgi:hypothetical protein